MRASAVYTCFLCGGGYIEEGGGGVLEFLFGFVSDPNHPHHPSLVTPEVFDHLLGGEVHFPRHSRALEDFRRDVNYGLNATLLRVVVYEDEELLCLLVCVHVCA